MSAARRRQLIIDAGCELLIKNGQHMTLESVAERAGVGQYVIFHHAPEHTDNHMDLIADEARMVFEDSIVAREGLILRP